MTPWVELAAAIVLEVAGTVSLKQSDGLARPLPALLVAVCYTGAFVALARALRHLEVGVAYAVWAGVGTAAVATLGIVVHREAASPLKLGSLALIVMGVAGLHWSTPVR